jgi:hypothetical protein
MGSAGCQRARILLATLLIAVIVHPLYRRKMIRINVETIYVEKSSTPARLTNNTCIGSGFRCRP